MAPPDPPREYVMPITLSASLVLYHNRPEEFGEAMQSFLRGHEHGQLFVIDNSSSALSHPLFSDPRVTYVFTGKNLGFGAGHNIALKALGNASDYHLLLNPDVRFGPDVLPALLDFMQQNPRIGVAMPQVRFPDGQLQRLCKLLPTPVDLILRRFLPSQSLRHRLNRKYELNGLAQDRPTCIPSLSGCFLVIRTSLLQRIGGFDERYFMYMEDVDLVRRLGDVSDTAYYPLVAIEHGYAKGSYRDRRLLMFHLRSALLYFRKWGWWIDPARRARNRAAVRQLRRDEGHGVG